jgi:hypothetical protein
VCPLQTVANVISVGRVARLLKERDDVLSARGVTNDCRLVSAMPLDACQVTRRDRGAKRFEICPEARTASANAMQ